MVPGNGRAGRVPRLRAEGRRVARPRPRVGNHRHALRPYVPRSGSDATERRPLTIELATPTLILRWLHCGSTRLQRSEPGIRPALRTTERDAVTTGDLVGGYPGAPERGYAIMKAVEDHSGRAVGAGNRLAVSRAVGREGASMAGRVCDAWRWALQVEARSFSNSLIASMSATGVNGFCRNFAPCVVSPRRRMSSSV